jgi:hypothetical protein
MKMVQWSIDSSGAGQYWVEHDDRDGWFEAAVRHTPGINSLFKISDRGFAERAREINLQIEKESAQEKLIKRSVFEANRGRLKKGEDFAEVFKDVREEFFSSQEIKTKEDRSSVLNLRGQFIAFDQRETDETPIIILLGTPTNEGKAKIMNGVIAPRMSQDEFNEFSRDMIKYKVISREVLIKMKTLDKENK